MPLTVKVNMLGLKLFDARQNSIELSVEGHPTLAQVIDLIDQQAPGFKQAILDPSGGLLKPVAILINGDNARYKGGVEALLNPDDVINIIPAIAGG